MSNLELKRRSILVTKHGSHAYGLNTPSSDLDVKGVLVGEQHHYLGYLNTVEQVEERSPDDLVIYEIRKFFKLAADCNPNIIEILFTDPSEHIYINSFGEELLAIRDQFLSQKAKHTFTGYALGQLKRLRNHHEWMKNPPKPPPTREAAGLPPNKNWCDGIEKIIAEYGFEPFGFTAQERYQLGAEKIWREESRKWAHYQEWLAGRNAKRHELEVKHGYDTKHGMHLVRLLRMGLEILSTGKVVVKRPDREELLAIRNGSWSYEQLLAYAEQTQKAIDVYYESGLSLLPHAPNRKRLDEKCVQLVSRYLDEEPYNEGLKLVVWNGNVNTPRP